MSTNDTDLTATFKQAIRQIREERRQARKQFETTDTEYQRREEAVQRAVEALGRPRFRVIDGVPATERRKPSVGKERFEAVQQYLDENPESRQSDIARALDFNPGTVTSALEILEREGKIKRGERVKKDGSTSWLWIKTDTQPQEPPKRRRRAKAA